MNLYKKNQVKYLFFLYTVICFVVQHTIGKG